MQKEKMMRKNEDEKVNEARMGLGSWVDSWGLGASGNGPGAKGGMRARINRNRFLVVAVMVCVAIAVTFFYVIGANRGGKEQPSGIRMGAGIQYMDIVSLQGEQLNADLLSQSQPVCMFIFPPGCPKCSSNVVFWSQIHRLTNNKAICLGIVLGSDSEAFEFLEVKKPKYPLYVPSDRRRFLEKWEIAPNKALTVLYYKGRIRFLYVGDLSGDAFTRVVSSIKNDL